MWVFGYGSLVWKVDFPYKSKLVGCVNGYLRRFWQGSEDHRGSPGNPGRVVTLVKSPKEEDSVWGVAYEISLEDENFVRNHLDFREKGGYKTHLATFVPMETTHPPFELEVYLGTNDNPYFLGPACEDEIALQISRAKGESGPNSEYLFELANAMKTIAPGINDPHLFRLEKKVKDILNLTFNSTSELSSFKKNSKTRITIS